jgi:hypothetical protein
MSQEMELKGAPKIIVLILILLIFLGITAYKARLYFDKTSINALNRDALILTIGPWLDRKMQKHESGDKWVQRMKAKAEKGNIYDYHCVIGLIDVRGFGDRVIAGLDITDSTGKRTRYFTLDWDSAGKKWLCSFYSSGDNSDVHPEENGYGLIGQFFHRARLEGTTDYQEKPLT